MSTKYAFVEFGHFGGEELVEPLDEVHDIAQVVSRLQPSQRILLRHHEAQDKRQQLALGVRFDRLRPDNARDYPGFAAGIRSCDARSSGSRK